MRFLIDSVNPSVNRSYCIDQAIFEEPTDIVQCRRANCPFLKTEKVETDDNQTENYIYCATKAEILLRSSLARHKLVIYNQIYVPLPQRDSYEKITAYALVDAKIEVLLENQNQIPRFNCFNGYSLEQI